MNTTALFVELMVIGAGVTIWISLLVFTFLGFNWVDWKTISSLIVLIPILSLTYSLGIIFDRIADKIFKRWDKKIRKEYFSHESDYFLAKIYTYTHANEKLINLYEYGRSRMRICRAWSLINLLLSVIAPIFIYVKTPNFSQKLVVSIFISIIFLIFFLASIFSWHNLNRSENKQLSQTYIHLKDENEQLKNLVN